MSVDKVTKTEWNNLFHEGMDAQAKEVIEAINNYNTMVKVYEKYRSEIKDYRINHYVDFDKGLLTYTLGTKRKIGFKQGHKDEQ